MNLAEQIYQTVKPLPESVANADWQNLMLAQSSALVDWNNQEDEVWNDVPASLSSFAAISVYQSLCE